MVTVRFHPQNIKIKYRLWVYWQSFATVKARSCIAVVLLLTTKAQQVQGTGRITQEYEEAEINKGT